MTIECNHCHKQFGEPQAVGLLFTGGPAAIITGIVCGALERYIHGWKFVIALPMWFFTTWFIWEFPRWIVSVRHAFRNCPNCGARDWGKPEYGGFGL